MYSGKIAVPLGGGGIREISEITNINKTHWPESATFESP
jgi:hypothetical protein